MDHKPPLGNFGLILNYPHRFFLIVIEIKITSLNNNGVFFPLGYYCVVLLNVDLRERRTVGPGLVYELFKMVFVEASLGACEGLFLLIFQCAFVVLEIILMIVVDLP